MTAINEMFPPKLYSDCLKNKDLNQIISLQLAWCNLKEHLRQERLESKGQNLWYDRLRFNKLIINNNVLCLRIPVCDWPENTLKEVVPRSAANDNRRLCC